jgi:hypothetical protein
MSGICRRGPGGQEPPRSDQAVLDDRHPDGKPALPGLCDCVDRHTSSDYRWVTTPWRSACHSGPYVRSESSSERSGISRAGSAVIGTTIRYTLSITY